MKNLYFIKKNNIRLVTKLALFVLVLFGRSLNSLAEGNSVAEINKRLSKSMFAYQNKQVLVGGDFSLDFTASAPYTYNHAIGGGAFDDRTIGKNADVVESLEGGDFKCHDIVSFLTKISVRTGALGNQTIRINYSFLAAATGQPGVSLGSFVDAYINNAPIIYGADGVTPIGEGPGNSDAGNREIGSFASAVMNKTFALTGPEFQKPSKLEGYVDITGLESGESVIVRVDVRIGCDGRKPTGNLQGAVTSAKVMSPVFSGNTGNISTGGQTVPFKNVDQIQQGSCELLPDYLLACEGDIQHYTLTTNGIPTWTLIGDAVFTDMNGNSIPNNNPGTALEAWVKATKPAGLKGSYTVKVDINSIVLPTSCQDMVDVYAKPDKPKVIIHEALLCGTATKPSLEVCSPIIGITYYLEDKNGVALSNITPTSLSPTVVFSNLTPGSGFKVKASNQGNCSSGYVVCGEEEQSGSCPGNTRQTAPQNQPQSTFGKANFKNLSAFPIPFSDKVTIEFKSIADENYVINLYNMQGQMVKQLKTGTAKAGEITRFELNGKGMVDSMYLVRKESKAGVETVKLLKKE